MKKRTRERFIHICEQLITTLEQSNQLYFERMKWIPQGESLRERKQENSEKIQALSGEILKMSGRSLENPADMKDSEIVWGRYQVEIFTNG